MRSSFHVLVTAISRTAEAGRPDRRAASAIVSRIRRILSATSMISSGKTDRRDAFQGVDDLAERKTHNVRVGNADLPDEEGAHPLTGVGARLVVALLHAGIPG